MSFPTGKLTFEFPDMNPQARIRELIIYIAHKSRYDRKFGKTKLVKLLHICDFESFRKYGRPITGHRYVKLPNGPFPDNLNQLLKEMVAEKDIAIKEDPYYGHTYPQHRVEPIRDANLSFFSSQEIEEIDGYIDNFQDFSGTEMANLTHGIAWQIPEMAEPIPYEASILSDEELTQEDFDHIDKLAKQYHGTTLE